jgi:16S rRNA (cytosine967-C5)-methyltransferase
MGPADDARVVAARLLFHWRKTGDFPEPAMERVRGRRELTMELVYGVIRWRRLLDTVRDWLVPRPPPPLPDCLLAIGLYQLILMDRIPEHAAVHATVQAAKRLAGPRTSRLVNAVLRRFLREQDALQGRIESLPIDRRWSHPAWLVDRWLTRYVRPDVVRLCQWNNRRPEVVLRACTSRTSTDQLLTRFRRAGIDAVPHPYAPDFFLTLPRGVAVPEVPGYAEGEFFVQDPSTHLSIQWLDPQPGEIIVDLCAAPGGKTAAIADALKGQGQIFAVDCYDDRLALLQHTFDRLAFRVVTPVRADGTRAESLREAIPVPPPVHRVLVDAPCSNTGVLARRPDARWRVDADRLPSFARTQAALLSAAAHWLAPGGVLVYSTCSLEPEEDESLVEAWLADHPAFELQRQARLFPPATRTDGVYAARLVRTR